MVFPRWVPSGKREPVPALVHAKGSGLGVLAPGRGGLIAASQLLSGPVGTPKIWCLSAAILLVPGCRG